MKQCNNGLTEIRLEYYDGLSDDDTVSHFAYGSEETRISNISVKVKKKISSKINHDDTLVLTDALLNYPEQEDESTSS